jgi:hypothetical protein
MTRTVPTTVALATLLAVSAIAPTGASASADQTRPTVRLGSPGFVVGQQIGTSDLRGGVTLASYTSDVPVNLRWSASDAAGICGYDVKRNYAGQAADVLAKGTSVTSRLDTVSDYDGSFGGGSAAVEGWTVTARDCAGKTASATAYNRVNVIQQNGESANAWQDPTVSSTGSWKTAACACWSGGSVAQTSARGASASFTWPFLNAGNVAVVMPKGADRGSATISIDGVKRATVNTNASANQPRVVVFSAPVSAGTHTVTVTNLATAGHARIDVDAFLVD